jgi:hypothetical protein
VTVVLYGVFSCWNFKRILYLFFTQRDYFIIKTKYKQYEIFPAQVKKASQFFAGNPKEIFERVFGIFCENICECLLELNSTIKVQRDAHSRCVMQKEEVFE